MSKSKKIVCRFFWYEGPLNWTAQECLRSFLRFPENRVEVYSYDPSANPMFGGCEWKDAGEILDKKIAEGYRLSMGSYSAASNLFRYQLLYKKGGWYFDTDCILLKPLAALDERDVVFGYQGENAPNVAVMKFSAGLPMFKEMYATCLEIEPSRYVWGMAGPQLFQTAIRKYNLESFGLPPQYFYPVHFSQVDLMRSRIVFSPDTHILHLWNEILRKNEWEKDFIYPGNLSYSLCRNANVWVAWLRQKLLRRLWLMQVRWRDSAREKPLYKIF